MEESYKKVSFQEAKHIIDTEPNCVILDVRDEDEYITGHAENAVLFPVDTIDEDTAESYGYTHIYDIGSLVDWPYGLEY